MVDEWGGIEDDEAYLLVFNMYNCSENNNNVNNNVNVENVNVENVDNKNVDNHKNSHLSEDIPEDFDPEKLHPPAHAEELQNDHTELSDHDLHYMKLHTLHTVHHESNDTVLENILITEEPQDEMHTKTKEEEEEDLTFTESDYEIVITPPYEHSEF